ncbi:hypothetical protein CBS101457_001131 [Exobasidium rhododendri]|nr:hypothetical protein CBS101457_001131 [Exobasidium rhododendri]
MAVVGHCIDLTHSSNDTVMEAGQLQSSGMIAVPPPLSPTTKPAVAPSASSQSSSSSSTNLTFNSYEIKALSSSRISYTRLPDILQHDQNKNVVNDSHAKIFKGYIQEFEESSAPLSVTNHIDPFVQPCPSADFCYTDGYQLTDTLERPTRRVSATTLIPRGCGCNNVSGICDPRTCKCYALHEQLAPGTWQDKDLSGHFAYSGGKLRANVVEMPGAPIWECNSYCSCTSECKNRVVQNGRTVGLDLFKSAAKGWGLRAMPVQKEKDRIKKGNFITVYAGELIGYEEAERRGIEYGKTMTTYVLDIDSHHIKRKLIYEPYLRMQRNKGVNLDGDDDDVQLQAEEWATETDTALLYSIDAGLWGNLSRFFNHSCEPNLVVYPVYTEERDLRRPFLAFFAKTDILPGEELTFDYGGDLAADEVPSLEVESSAENMKAAAKEQLQTRRMGTEVTVKGLDGKLTLKGMKCGCGAARCRKTIFH